jgi:hypothetical protein
MREKSVLSPTRPQELRAVLIFDRGNFDVSLNFILTDQKSNFRWS